MRAIDTSSNVVNIVDDIVVAGFNAVGRYYSSNVAKQLTPAEVKAISAVGLKIFVVFEDAAKPDLTYSSGQRDAKTALRQAAVVGQPAGSAIYFALDSDYDTPDLTNIRNYFSGIKDTIGGSYKLGVYSDGVVCEALLDSQVCEYAWLSASRSFPGTKAFYKSKRWALAQDPNEQTLHGLNVDIDEVNGEFGGFQVGPALVQGQAVGPSATPWMDWMRLHQGEVQQTGAKPTQFTETIFQHTDFGPLNGVTPQSCAATVCAALELSGYSSTHSAAAKSYLNYGVSCPLQPGCIVVFRWPSGDYHVDFCDAIVDADTVRGLGGNQGHQLRDTDYLSKFIRATRWPVRRSAAAPAAVGPGSFESRLYAPYWQPRAIRPAQSGVANAFSWTIPELCKAYSWPTSCSGGGVIAIVELGGGWVRSDMETFFANIGQPMPQIVDVSVDGSQNNPNQPVPSGQIDPDVEVALDIQVAAASYFVATGKSASIRVYWASGADPTAFATAVSIAVKDGCDVCTISWGSDEAQWQAYGGSQGRDFMGEMEAAVRAATSAGMIVLAAAGDNDSSDGGPSPANVEFPASCPHIISCGGTSKTAVDEVVWNNNPGQTDGKGTGGGYSTVFPIQSFQIGAPSPPTGLGRMVPDVAANADPLTGYSMVVHGLPITMGGTSAVAPLYAGLFASFGRKLGFVTPKLWLSRCCFNDITVGDNGEYSAAIGPDPCTGLGSPIGTKLAALFGEFAASSASSGPVSAVPNGWSGTVSYVYADGFLSRGPLLEPLKKLSVESLTVAGAGTYTVHQGHRYSAEVTLTGLDQLASDAMIVDKLTHLGFRDVTVTGSGSTRAATGVWTGADTTVRLDPHLSNVKDLG